MDIRLYKNTSVYTDTSNSIEGLEGALLSDIPSSNTELIANKVVKFLLTYKGTDLIDTEYGGRAFFTTQISEQYLPRFYLELQQDITRCQDYIFEIEKDLGDVEKLLSINIVNISYDSKLSPTRLDIKLKILTTENNTTVLSIPTVS